MAFTCSVCEKCFTRKDSLTRHQQNCTATTIDKPYHCTSCPATYTQKHVSNNTLLPSTAHYLTVYHAPPAHIHSPIQTTSTIINNFTPHPNITSAHHVPVPSSVSTLSAYTKNHASRGESVQPPPLYQHHQNDKGVVGSHLSGQLYGTTLRYTPDGLWTGTGHFRTIEHLNTRRRLYLHSRPSYHQILLHPQSHLPESRRSYRHHQPGHLLPI